MGNRIFHRYEKWEDYKAGMWRTVDKISAERFLREAIAFTGNAEVYGEWMMRVIVLWPLACEHNLTDDTQNRKAWIGHAACQLAIECPEYITRSAWGYLNKNQQDEANAMADLAIARWETMNRSEDSKDAQMFFEY
jgi:hypothetical protein